MTGLQGEQNEVYDLPSPVIILGVPVTPVTVESLHRYIYRCIQGGQHRLILNVNVHALNLAYSYPWYREIFQHADLVFCDGAGVLLAARMLNLHLPQRITYADWMWQLADFSSDHSFSLFFLGSRPGVAEKAATRLKEKLPNLNIVGVHHGFFDKTKFSLENEKVVQLINRVSPDILIVGFGMPLQELWLNDNWERLNVRVALTGGAVFDYISGKLNRAPRWMNDHGLEWLGRLLIEPGRLWKRYLIGNPLFIWRILKQKIALTRNHDHPEVVE